MSYRHACIEVIKELFGLAGSSARPLSSSMIERASLVTPASPPSTATQKADENSAVFVPLGTHTVAYVGVTEAPLFIRPVQAFDSVQLMVPYATTVTVLRHEGRFSSVAYKDTVGWVYKDDLVYSSEAIFPVFISGTPYDAHHPATQAVRRLLKDAFFTESLFLPLLSVEYVTYRLLRDARTIAWPAVRPRPAGTWHTLLRGVRGVHVGLLPHTGAVIEYQEEGEGVVGFVEVVRPDGTVVVSTVGSVREGVFERGEMTQEVYRERRALFITVT